MTVANPEVTASLRGDIVTAGLTPERLLVVGSMTSGTAGDGALVQNILNDGAEDALFGEDSPIAAAIRRIRRVNKQTQVDAIGLADAGGATAATGTTVVAGTATEDGTFTVYIGSKKFNAYPIAVTSGDTATVVGDAIEAAVAADAKALVTPVNAAGTVTHTAKTAGLFGDSIGIKIVGSVAGLTLSATAMSGGATDPTLTGVFDVVGNQRYQGVVWQFTSALDLPELTDFLDARFNVANDVLDGRGVVAMTQTLAQALAIGATLNSPSLSVCVDNLIDRADHRGPAILDVPFVKAAEFAAIRALRRTDEAVLGGLVISRSPRDSFGGPWQNSKPYFNSPLNDLELPDVGDSFEDLEISQLKDAGLWVMDANRARSAVIAGEVVTTYKTDNAGNEDGTFKFLNYVDTGTAAREFIVNNTRAKYAQYRAVGGALIPDVDSANEASIASYVAELNGELGELALVNTGTGTLNGEAVDYDKLFRENLTVTLNPATGKFLVSAKLYIVVQLRGVTYDFAIAFEV